MKNAIVSLSAAALALGLAACSGSTDSDGGTYCSVSRSGNSVSVSAGKDGRTYTSVGTYAVGSDTIYFHSVYTYPNLAMAEEGCADEKEEASYWRDGSYRVECSGNRVVVDDLSTGVDVEDLDDAESDFNRMCRNLLNPSNRDYDDDDDY